MTRTAGAKEARGRLPKQFTATLQKSLSKGGWTYVVMPGSVDSGDRVTINLDERVT